MRVGVGEPEGDGSYPEEQTRQRTNSFQFWGKYIFKMISIF